MRFNPLLVRILLIAWTVLAFGGAVVAEPVYLDSSAAGLYELDGESRLQVDGVQGLVVIRVGGDGQVRFRSSAVDDKHAEIPVEMWKDGRTLILRPREAGPYDGIRLEASVPTGMSLDLLLDDSEVMLSNIFGDVTLRGAGLDSRILSVQGSVSLELVDSSVEVQGVEGDLELESRGGDVRVERLQGQLGVELQGGRFQAGDLGGPVELDGEGAEVILVGNRDTLRATLSEGSLKADGIALGGVFNLDRTPLELKNCRGDIRVETDAAIGFSECEADLHFDAYGSPVAGNGNTGILEVKTDDAKVFLRKLNGPTRIQGDRLEVDLQEIGGELWVLGTSSNIKIDNVIQPVTVTNEFGDIHILAATHKVEVTSRDGNVTIERQTGPVDISADGEQVAVSWSSMRWTENSSVTNTGGDIALFLPKQGGCSVDARASYGRIETDIEEFVVEDDERTAYGTFNRARTPLLKVRAEGDLSIMKAPILE